MREGFQSLILVIGLFEIHCWEKFHQKKTSHAEEFGAKFASTTTNTAKPRTLTEFQTITQISAVTENSNEHVTVSYKELFILNYIFKIYIFFM